MNDNNQNGYLGGDIPATLTPGQQIAEEKVRQAAKIDTVEDKGKEKPRKVMRVLRSIKRFLDN